MGMLDRAAEVIFKKDQEGNTIFYTGRGRGYVINSEGLQDTIRRRFKRYFTFVAAVFALAVVFPIFSLVELLWEISIFSSRGFYWYWSMLLGLMVFLAGFWFRHDLKPLVKDLLQTDLQLTLADRIMDVAYVTNWAILIVFVFVQLLFLVGVGASIIEGPSIGMLDILLYVVFFLFCITTFLTGLVIVEKIRSGGRY